MKPNSIAFELKDQFAAAYEKGQTLISISERYGITRWSVTAAIIHVLGIERFKEIAKHNLGKGRSIKAVAKKETNYKSIYAEITTDAGFDLGYIRNRPLVLDALHPMFKIHSCLISHTRLY